jgi:hypothetical protein
VWQLAAAFLPARLLAGFRNRAPFPATKPCNEAPASKLAGQKAAASYRTLKLGEPKESGRECPHDAGHLAGLLAPPTGLSL